MSMPPMLEPQMHAQMAAVGAAATLLADGDGGMLGAVFDTLRNIFTGVLLVGLIRWSCRMCVLTFNDWVCWVWCAHCG